MKTALISGVTGQDRIYHYYWNIYSITTGIVSYNGNIYTKGRKFKGNKK
jgi:hypothetical protein